MSDMIKTSEIKHTKFTIPIPWNKECGKTVTYYIAQIVLEGLSCSNSFQIHSKIEGNNEGYCGSTLDFLMEDGTIEKVKGPFFEYEEQHTRVFWDILTGKEWK